MGYLLPLPLDLSPGFRSPLPYCASFLEQSVPCFADFLQPLLNNAIFLLVESQRISLPQLLIHRFHNDFKPFLNTHEIPSKLCPPLDLRPDLDHPVFNVLQFG